MKESANCIRAIPGMRSINTYKEDRPVQKPLLDEYDKTLKKRDEVRESLRTLEKESHADAYNIMITRDRLAYWEGRAEGLKFALDYLGDR